MSDETKARELADGQGLICPDLCTDHPHCSCGVTETAIVGALREARRDERERLAREIIADLPPVTTKDLGVRVGMVLAARIVERGRRLTMAEKMENLFRAVNEPEPTP